MRAIESGRLTGYYRWWVPVADIQVDDLVLDDVRNEVYRVTSREDQESSIIFEAAIDAKLSGPRVTTLDLALIFRNLQTCFIVLKQTAPDDNQCRMEPS